MELLKTANQHALKPVKSFPGKADSDDKEEKDLGKVKENYICHQKMGGECLSLLQASAWKLAWRRPTWHWHLLKANPEQNSAAALAKCMLTFLHLCRIWKFSLFSEPRLFNLAFRLLQAACIGLGPCPKNMNLLMIEDWSIADQSSQVPATLAKVNIEKGKLQSKGWKGKRGKKNTARTMRRARQSFHSKQVAATALVQDSLERSWSLQSQGWPQTLPHI